jgi:hypothetical protein
MIAFMTLLQNDSGLSGTGFGFEQYTLLYKRTAEAVYSVHGAGPFLVVERVMRAAVGTAMMRRDHLYQIFTLFCYNIWARS